MAHISNYYTFKGNLNTTFKHITMKKAAIALLLSLSLTEISGSAFAQEPISYVNTLMGTESTYQFSNGNTYPAVAVPWGMNFWSPQTGDNRSGWMYSYNDKEIRGFRQTHQPSPWINDYGTFAIMPISGDLKMVAKERGATYKQANQLAQPNYYRVTFDNGTTTELTATSRGSIFSIRFAPGQKKYVVVDAYDGGSAISISKDRRRITGYVKNNSGGVPANFANYFVIEFDKPILACGTSADDVLADGKLSAEAAKTAAYIQPDVKDGEVLTVRVASSFISPEQAELNFKKEVANKSFETVRKEASDKWNSLMGRIKVEGGSNEQLRTFYSCLYRVLLFPREFYEFDAAGMPTYYSPYDGKIHSGYMYTDNGFWDTFRAVHPLFTLVYPEVSERIMQSLVNVYNESGFLPEWASPGHRGCMIGNNSLSLITDAWMKGIRNFDANKALEAMVHQATTENEIHSVGRHGAPAYFKLGYVPYPDYNESTAKTLEYAYADWCLSQFAASLGKKDISKRFEKSSYSYRNVFDTKLGFVRGKDKNGKWIEPFDAVEWGGPFTEGSSWHWTWSVMHNVEDLSKLFGGHEAMGKRLDSLFTAPNTYKVGTYGFVIHEIAEMVALNMGQYAHGNQPIQHAIYLYNHVGQPWKAQYHLRDVMAKLYNAGSRGYCGDEDNGQTSAWYVFTAMGFYPVTPGKPEYVMGSPLFRKMTLSLSNGKKFVVEADNNSNANVYIESAQLKGKTFTKNFLTHKQIVDGGTLKVKMSSKPNKTRGTKVSDLPYSLDKK